MRRSVFEELALRVECRTEAGERAEQRVDLVKRVLAPLRRCELEPQADLVRAVADPEPNLRLRRPAPPVAAGRVLDEDTDARVAVVALEVEQALLVDPD